MASSGDARRTTGETVELWQEIIDFFHISGAGKLVTEEINNRLEAYRIELEQSENKREKDLVIKGRIAELNYVLKIPERLRNKVKNKGD
jgi:hypothetical protein